MGNCVSFYQQFILEAVSWQIWRYDDKKSQTIRKLHSHGVGEQLRRQKNGVLEVS